MAKAPSLGKPHNIRVNDEAFFFLQRKFIEFLENGSKLNPIEIASNLILNNKRI